MVGEAAWPLITAFSLPSIEEKQKKVTHNNIFVIPMASSFRNFASRVLSVDQEQSSFAPIVGLDKARNMTISDSMKLAWTSCAKLRGAMSADDIEVCYSMIPNSVRTTKPPAVCAINDARHSLPFLLDLTRSPGYRTGRLSPLHEPLQP